MTDRSNPLTDEMADDLGVTFIPLHIRLGDRRQTASRSFDLSHFYARLAEGDRPRGTEAPTPEEVLDVLARAHEAHDAVVVVCASKKVSAIYELVRAARASLPGRRIEVVDAGPGAIASALAVTAAARARDRGASVDEAVSTIERIISLTQTVAVVESFAVLESSPALPLAGEVFRSIQLAHRAIDLTGDGRVDLGLADAAAGLGPQLEHLVDARIDPAKPLRVWVLHTDRPGAARSVLAWCRARFDCSESFASDAGPVTAAHMGAGLLGLSWYQE